MQLDVHVSFEQVSEVLSLLKSLSDKTDLILQKQEAIMPLLDDLKVKADANLAKAQANSDADDSILLIVSGFAQTIRDLKAALDAAGTDPAKLTALGVTMDQTAAVIDADKQKVVDAVNANTTP